MYRLVPSFWAISVPRGIAMVAAPVHSLAGKRPVKGGAGLFHVLRMVVIGFSPFQRLVVPKLKSLQQLSLYGFDTALDHSCRSCARAAVRALRTGLPERVIDKHDRAC